MMNMKWGINLLLFQDLPEQSLQCFDNVISVAPDFDMAHYAKGFALMGIGRLEEALKSYDKALDINPYLGRALANKSQVLKFMGRIPEARHCQQLARLVTVFGID